MKTLALMLLCAGLPFGDKDESFALYLETPVWQAEGDHSSSKNRSESFRRALEKSKWFRLVDDEQSADVILLEVKIRAVPPPRNWQFVPPVPMNGGVVREEPGPERTRYIIFSRYEIPAAEISGVLEIDDEAAEVFEKVRRRFVKELEALAKQTRLEN